MPTSNSHSVNEIDYGSLHEQAIEPEKTSEKKKTEGISSRSIKKEKSVAEAAPIDVNELATKSSQLSKQLGEPKSPDGYTKYAPEILGGLGILGALAAAHHHYTNSRPAYGESNAGKPPEPKPDMRNIGAVAPPAPKLSAQDQALLDASERNRMANEAAAAAKTNPVPTGYTQGVPGPVSPMSQLTGQPTTPAPINAAPPAPPAPPAAPVDLVAAAQSGQDMSQPIKEDVAHMLQEANNKPVEKVVYPKGESLKSIPPGFVFREDVGNLDRSLGNILGKEHREYARELFNQGKPFGHSSDLNNDVSKLTNQYFQHLQSQVPETILGRDARRAQNIPSEFGTFAKNTNFGQKAKIGGVAGTLFALADLANASQPSAGNAVVPPKTSEGGAAFGGFTSGKKYQAAKKRAEQADINSLPDPRTYAAVQSLMGVPPDEQGFSVLHPDYQNIRGVADPAYAASLLTALSPRGLSKLFGK